MEGKVGYERPNFEEDYEFELKWKSWKLYFLMENFLTTDWLVLILNYSSFSVPTTNHKVKSS